MFTGTSAGGLLSGVWGTAENDVYAVGADGFTLHYNGSAWSRMTSETTENLYSVWGNGSNDIYAVGVSGTVLHYDGSSWNSMNSGTSAILWQVLATPFDVFAVGSGGAILRKTS